MSNQALTFESASGVFLNSPFALPAGGIPVVDTSSNASLSIDQRIAGLTANSSTKNIYSTYTHASGGTYVRSTTVWCADVDISPVSLYNSATADGRYPVIAISPRHVLIAEHVTEIIVGTSFRFLGRDGAIYTRTLLAVDQVGSTDIEIGYLSSDLPSTVSFAKVLPSDAASFLAIERLPVFLPNQTREALVWDLTTTLIAGQAPTNSQRLAFNENLSAGDSSDPACLVIGNELVVLFPVHTAGAGSMAGDGVSANYAAINSAMTGLGGSYQLTDIGAPGRITNAGYSTASALPLITLGNTTGNALKLTSTSGNALSIISTTGRAFSTVTGDGIGMNMQNESATYPAVIISNNDSTSAGPLMSFDNFTDSSILVVNNDGSITFGDTTSTIHGTATNNSAAAGILGQIISSLVATGSPVTLTTNTAANVTSISLTAGDWDIEGNVNFNLTGATATAFSAGISLTTATVPTDGSEVASGVVTTAITGVNGITLPRKRVSIAGTTTVYLVAKSTFTLGSETAFGGITARRVR